MASGLEIHPRTPQTLESNPSIHRVLQDSEELISQERNTKVYKSDVKYGGTSFIPDPEFFHRLVDVKNLRAWPCWLIRLPGWIGASWYDSREKWRSRVGMFLKFSIFEQLFYLPTQIPFPSFSGWKGVVFFRWTTLPCAFEEWYPNWAQLEHLLSSTFRRVCCHLNRGQVRNFVCWGPRILDKHDQRRRLFWEFHLGAMTATRSIGTLETARRCFPAFCPPYSQLPSLG